MNYVESIHISPQTHLIKHVAPLYRIPYLFYFVYLPSPFDNIVHNQLHTNGKMIF